MVTICNKNPTLTDSSIDFLVNSIEEFYSIKKPSFSTKLEFINVFLNSDTELKEYINFYWAKVDDEQKISFGYSLSDFVLKCEFKGQKCDMDLDFKRFFSYRHGNCWMFNFNNTKKARFAIEDYSLILELFFWIRRRFAKFWKYINYSYLNT